MLSPDQYFPRRKVTTRLEEWQEEDLSSRRAAAKRALHRALGYLEGNPQND